MTNVYLSFGRGSEAEFEMAKSVVQGLGLHTWEWNTSPGEYFDRNLYQILKTEVERADMFVGIYDQYYGWIPKQDRFGENTTDGEHSIFHMEYRWALARKIPMFIYFSTATPTRTDDTVESELSRIKKLEDFKSEMRTNHFIHNFQSLEELRKLLGSTLIRVAHHQRYGKGQPGRIVFISHSSANDAFVSTLAEQLIAVNLQPWVDHLHLTAGADWDVTLEHMLDAADMMIVVLSPESVKSQVVKAEWSYFGESGRKIYPILYQDSIIPFRLRVLQFIDYRQDAERAFKQLCAALGVSDPKSAAISHPPPQNTSPM